MFDANDTQHHINAADGSLLLIPRFKTLRPGRQESVTLINRSADDQTVTLHAEYPQSVIALHLEQTTIHVPAGQQIEVKVSVSRASVTIYPEGRSFPINLRANGTGVTPGVVTITVELPPRYEWALSLLILLGACGGLTLFGLLLLNQPQPTPTTAVLLVTDTPTRPTRTPTRTPFSVTLAAPTTMAPPTTAAPIVAVQQSCEEKSWHEYTVREDDATLSGILQLAVTNPTLKETSAYNNLAESGHIGVGQKLCVPRIYKAELISLTADSNPVCGTPFSANLVIRNIGTLLWEQTVRLSSVANGLDVFAQDYVISVPVDQELIVPLSITNAFSGGFNQNLNLTITLVVEGQDNQSRSTNIFLTCNPRADFEYWGSHEYSASGGDFLISQLVTNTSTQDIGATYEWTIRIEYWWSATLINTATYTARNPVIPDFLTTYGSSRVTIKLRLTSAAGTDVCEKEFRLAFERPPTTTSTTPDCD